MRRCVIGFTDTCRKSVSHYQNGTTPAQFQSDIAACWLPEGPGLVTVSYSGVSGRCSTGCSKNCAT
jgi:hypothetical protein